MEPNARTLAEFLSFAALIAATIEYCEVIARRQAARLEAAFEAECAQTALFGLVRVLAVDT